MANASGLRPLAGELSFLAPPGEVADWRLVVAFEAAATMGLLDGLPATAHELAGRRNTDERVTEAVLEALCIWQIVSHQDDGTYLLGPAAPDAAATAVLRHHAAALRMWSSRIEDRLGGTSDGRSGRGSPSPEPFLASLAVHAQRRAARLADVCLELVPGATSVLDLGGGHGEYAMEFARRGCQVVLQDRAPMIDVVKQWGRATKAGVALFVGDFFEALPDRQFDLVLCAGVTHTYDAEHNRDLYRRVYPIVAPGGSFALSTILPGDTPTSRLFALQMLSGGNGGDTHSEMSYRLWLSEAGFASVVVVPLDESDRSLLAARKSRERI